jgi:hypothetical protein
MPHVSHPRLTRTMTLASFHRSGRSQPPAALPGSGSYVTDGHRLFRVVSQFAFVGDHVFASLEDCLTLDVQPYAPSELCEMRLRPVTTEQ